MIKVNIKKSFVNKAETFQLNLSFQIKEGSFTAISGASGAGKTSLLRMIAGLDKPDSGKLEIHSATTSEKLWFDSEQKINIKTQKRKVAMVFQEPALFPNMSILENLSYASNKDLKDILQLTGIENLIDRFPSGLSGGQKQRVALASAVAQAPDILLLDEPFSALDNKARYALQQTLGAIHKKLGLTTLMVTHDQSEILRLADGMLIIEDGSIKKQGKPVELIANNQLSGKFQFQGELVDLRAEGILYLASVLIGNQIIQIVIDRSEADLLSIGDKVVVASKAFNPIIKKIG